MLHEQDEQNKKPVHDEGQKPDVAKQEKTDPQLTELRGFIDPSEDLEPTLQDGTKSPDKAGENEGQ